MTALCVRLKALDSRGDRTYSGCGPVSLSDGCLVAGPHPPLLSADVRRVLRPLLAEEQVHRQFQPHQVHQNSSAAAEPEICKCWPPAHHAQLQVSDEGLYRLSVLSQQKEQQFGDVRFEDRSKELKELPRLSTDFNSWLNLTVSAWLTMYHNFFLSDNMFYYLCVQPFIKTHYHLLIFYTNRCTFFPKMEQPYFSISVELKRDRCSSFASPWRVVLKRV